MINKTLLLLKQEPKLKINIFVLIDPTLVLFFPQRDKKKATHGVAYAQPRG